MKKLTNAKWFILGVICTLMMSMLVVPAVAASMTKDATLTYRDIKITLDGAAITPKDANGNAVEPFIIDGTTYLPVRAVGEALGLGVGWDNDTSTVLLASDGIAPSIPATTGSVAITGASLANYYSVPRLHLDFENSTSDSIARIDIRINCFNAYKEPASNGLTNVYNGYTIDIIGANAADSVHWDLYGFSGTYYVEFAIVKYVTTSGNIVEIPETDQAWYSATMN